MEDLDTRTWINSQTLRENLEMRFTINLEAFPGLEQNDIMDAMINLALKDVESENPIATDSVEDFLSDIDWMNIAQVILDDLHKLD